MLRRSLLGALCVQLASASWSTAATATASSPDVSGPVPGPPLIYGHTTFDLAWVGYEQAEFFFSGTASAYEPTAPLTTDGRWAVAPVSPAPFTSRIVVNRPADPIAFNGTVVVEWLNVSGGADASPDWVHTHVELIRQGYAWVGVSAQAVGVESLERPDLGDPARYAALSHPGDSYSYDIFSQAGQAVLDDAATILGGLKPQRLLAIGESQSARRLVTYINAAHPVVDVYDGFLVHSRQAQGAQLTQDPLPLVEPPAPTSVRDDLDVPVLVFQTENDTGGLQVRQADSDRFRWWEVAGTAHFDLYGLLQGATDIGGSDTVGDWFHSLQHPTTDPVPGFSCQRPINSGPQTYVLRAAVSHLDRWMRGGTPPPVAPRYRAVSADPPQYEVDAVGNVEGGIRTPAVDVPVAKLNGLGQPPLGAGDFCRLFGITEPLSPGELGAAYGDRDGFVAAWQQAAAAAAAAGFLLAEDAALLRDVVSGSSLRLARSLARACPDPAPAGFVDVDPSSAHAAGIDCASAWGVVTGVDGDRFAPGAMLTRGQLASVLVQTIETIDGTLPAPDDRFVDDDGSVHEDAIDKLAAAGIVNGIDADRYAADGDATREQFASMLAAAMRFVGGDVPGGRNAFSDDDGSVHEPAIDGLATFGIVTGDASGAFQPVAMLHRGQAATMVSRMLDALVEAGLAEAPAG